MSSSELCCKKELLEKRLSNAMSSLQQLKNYVINRESLISEYTDLLINDIDIQVESIINEVHKAREELFEKISSYKAECLKNSANLTELNIMLVWCQESYDDCLKRLNENQHGGVSHEIEELVDDLNTCRKELETKLFGEKRWSFLASKIKVSTTMIGVLSSNPCITKLCETIQATIHSVSVFNYEHEHNRDEFEYTDVFFREIEENKIFILAPKINSAGYDEEDFVDAVIYTPSGTVEQDTFRYPNGSTSSSIYSCAMLKDANIVYAYGHMITILNHNLEALDSIELYEDDDETEYDNVNGLFVNDSNQIVVLTDKMMLKYDSKLALLGSKPIEDGTCLYFHDDNYKFISGKIYSINSTRTSIEIFDSETSKLVKKIKLQRKAKIIMILDDETILFVDPGTKKFEFFNFDMKCLFEFHVQNLPDFTDISINLETGNLLLNDSKNGNIYFIKS